MSVVYYHLKLLCIPTLTEFYFIGVAPLLLFALFLDQRTLIEVNRIKLKVNDLLSHLRF